MMNVPILKENLLVPLQFLLHLAYLCCGAGLGLVWTFLFLFFSEPGLHHFQVIGLLFRDRFEKKGLCSSDITGHPSWRITEFYCPFVPTYRNISCNFTKGKAGINSLLKIQTVNTTVTICNTLWVNPLFLGWGCNNYCKYHGYQSRLLCFSSRIWHQVCAYKKDTEYWANIWGCVFVFLCKY